MVPITRANFILELLHSLTFTQPNIFLITHPGAPQEISVQNSLSQLLVETSKIKNDQVKGYHNKIKVTTSILPLYNKFLIGKLQVHPMGLEPTTSPSIQNLRARTQMVLELLYNKTITDNWIEEQQRYIQRNAHQPRINNSIH